MGRERHKALCLSLSLSGELGRESVGGMCHVLACVCIVAVAEGVSKGCVNAVAGPGVCFEIDGVCVHPVCTHLRVYAYMHIFVFTCKYVHK